jgi:hypothetical protein
MESMILTNNFNCPDNFTGIDPIWTTFNKLSHRPLIQQHDAINRLMSQFAKSSGWMREDNRSLYSASLSF